MRMRRACRVCVSASVGWWARKNPRPQGADIWCSQRDIAELIKCCIDALDELQFDIFYGMSDNERRWVDIESAVQAVGYISRDRAAG